MSDQKQAYDHLQSSIDDLQSRLAFQEDTIQTLSDLIHRQQQQIDYLSKQEQLLKEQLQNVLDERGGSITDERPPHY